jgi:hypothetical protein
MIIDRGHLRWVGICLAILVLSTAVYVPYHVRSLNGPSGGSLIGLVYGFVGYGLMLFAGALGVRTRRPTWRFGRAETWLKGHVWLALLAYPLIFFHAGFAFGGPLTVALMILFTIVTVSGLVGVVLQGILPRMMTERVPLETIFEQVDNVLAQIRGEADHLVKAVADPEQASADEAAATVGRRPPPSARRAQVRAQMGTASAPTEEAQALKEFYENEVRPYLFDKAGRTASLNSPSKAAVVFAQLRTRVPDALHHVVDDLQAICEERRQLRVQAGLHYWLHAWLLVHVPLSIALLLLSAAHAVLALRY